MEILIGTNNENKLTQYRRIFERHLSDARLFSLVEKGIVDDVEEDADNLRDNAIKKAQFFGRMSGMMTISDDTGLFIDALDGDPGIHAKRWLAGSETDRNQKILERMKNVPDNKRTCRYKGVVAIYEPDKDRCWVHESSLEGKIARISVDGVGFGYDPIFITIAYGKYYSQLSDDERDAISHRGLGILEFSKHINK